MVRNSTAASIQLIRSVHVLAVMATLICFPSTTLAQQENLTQKEAAEQRLAAIVSPGPFHDFLQRFLGTWTIETRVFQGEAASPAERGTAECLWQIEGRWLLIRNAGTLTGRPMLSETSLGYDNFKQSFVASTISNLDTAMNRAEGDLNADLTQLTLYGTTDEYLTGELARPVKYVWKFQSFDRMTFEVHDLGIGDVNTKVVEITYLRKPKDVVIGADAAPELVWNEGAFTEGVAVRSDGLVYFSDIHSAPGQPGRILVYDPTSGLTKTFCSDSQKSNGLYFDANDRLFACCGADQGARALCEVTADGKIVVISDRFNGHRFNSPNDLVILSNGNIYFSDPRYVGSEPLEMDAMNVYVLNVTSNILSIATREIEKPNGVDASPDGKFLYVADTNTGSLGLPGEKPGPVGKMTLNRFDIDPSGRLRNKRVLVDFGKEAGIDGMCVHSSGRIYAAVRTPGRFGIAVYSPDGDELAFVPTPELPTNCCFGVGENSNTLYITAGKGLYRLKLETGATK
ncbi:MAG: SMP-30/gluconolactonase/LRE family protein [Planctomyces sp.]|nr:SMP-30/gluconolactonase/LRE family protein [Planctomyces sp.]